MSDEKGFRERLVVLEKNRAVDLAFLVVTGLGVGLFGSAIAFHFAFGILGIHLAVIASLLRWGAVRQNAYAKPHDRTVAAGSTGVVVDGVPIPRAAIADGWYQPRAPVKMWRTKRPASSTVQLVDKRKRIVFEAEVATEDKAVAMLRALGLDASQKRAEFRGSSPLIATQPRNFALGLGFAALMFAWMFVGSSLHHFTPFPLVFGAAPLVLLSILPSKIIVGVDGVLARWLWWKRFTPMSKIKAARSDGTTRIALQLTNGKTETIYTTSAKHQGGVHQHHRDVILARIHEAQRAHDELGPGADVAVLVARGARSTAEWKQALASLGENDTGYRRAAIREEDLWRVVEDPRAAADARAGAAQLLRRGLDDEGKARVRVAAEATASPKLRIALEAATGDDDEAVDEALAELGSEKSV